MHTDNAGKEEDEWKEIYLQSTKPMMMIHCDSTKVVWYKINEELKYYKVEIESDGNQAVMVYIWNTDKIKKELLMKNVPNSMISCLNKVKDDDFFEKELRNNVLHFIERYEICLDESPKKKKTKIII